MGELALLGQHEREHRRARARDRRRQGDIGRERERAFEVVASLCQLAAFERDPAAHAQHRGVTLDESTGPRRRQRRLGGRQRLVEPPGADEVRDDPGVEAVRVGPRALHELRRVRVGLGRVDGLDHGRGREHVPLALGSARQRRRQPLDRVRLVALDRRVHPHAVGEQREQAQIGLGFGRPPTEHGARHRRRLAPACLLGERRHELERDLRVRGRPPRLLEPRPRLARARGVFGTAQFEEHLDAVRQRGRLAAARHERDVDAVGRQLVERAAQVGGGELRRALVAGAAGRLAQGLRNPRVERRRRGQQMRGDDPGRSATLREQPRGPRMGRAALDRRLQVRDRRPDQRVLEAQRSRVLEQVGGDQLRGRAPRGVELEAGERGSEQQLAAVPEQRDRGGQRRCSIAERREPPGHPPRDPLDARRDHGARVRGVELGQHLPHEQRVAAGRTPAGIHERRRHLAEPPLREHADRGRGQRRGSKRIGLGRERLEHRPVLAGQRGPRGDDDRDRKLLHPPGEVGQEAQARLVAPLGVVDGKQQRRVGGEAGDEPVEPVQRREPRVGRRGRRGRGLRRSGQAERRGGQCGGSLQPAGRRRVRATAARRRSRTRARARSPRPSARSCRPRARGRGGPGSSCRSPRGLRSRPRRRDRHGRRRSTPPDGRSRTRARGARQSPTTPPPSGSLRRAKSLGELPANWRKSRIRCAWS